METKNIMDDLARVNMLILTEAEKELYKIIEPINDTRKLKYRVSSKFVTDGNLTKAWKQIVKIVEAHQWLMNNNHGGGP